MSSSVLIFGNYGKANSHIYGYLNGIWIRVRAEFSHMVNIHHHCQWLTRQSKGVDKLHLEAKKIKEALEIIKQQITATRRSADTKLKLHTTGRISHFNFSQIRKVSTNPSMERTSQRLTKNKQCSSGHIHQATQRNSTRMQFGF